MKRVILTWIRLASRGWCKPGVKPGMKRTSEKSFLNSVGKDRIKPLIYERPSGKRVVPRAKTRLYIYVETGFFILFGGGNDGLKISFSKRIEVPGSLILDGGRYQHVN